MFSCDEAFSFIEDSLKVDNARERMKEATGHKKRELLDNIITNFQVNIPFTNVRLLSMPLEQRHRPDLDEIKTDLVSRIGGICYNMNVGLHFLLRAVGFRSSLSLSTVTSTAKFPPNHVVVCVRDVQKSGDIFLAEAGLGFPTFRAIDLSFEKESPEFHDSYLEYKYVKHEGRLCRMHRKGCPVRAMGPHGDVDFYLGEWRQFCWTALEDTALLESLDDIFDRVFTDPKVTHFHNVLKIQGFPENKAAILNGKTLLCEGDDGELVKTQIEGEDEGIATTARKYFPRISEELVRAALKHTPTTSDVTQRVIGQPKA